MSAAESGPAINSYRGRDGVALAYREMGRGRPLILLHGYLSTSMETWVRPGHAARLAARGRRVIMPDLRGHGHSDKPHGPEAYPPDVLAEDGLSLIEHLGVSEYDLGGYSLGGHTVVRMLVRGARPGRAIVAGTGLDELLNTDGRGGHFRDSLTAPGPHEPGSLEQRTHTFIAETGGDAVALLNVLDTSVATPREAIAKISVPTLVLAGAEDRRTSPALATTLARSRHAVVPGDHYTAISQPSALGEAIADFLDLQPGPPLLN